MPFITFVFVSLNVCALYVHLCMCYHNVIMSVFDYAFWITMLKTAKSFLRMKASVTANPARSSASDAETIKKIRRPLY